MKWERDTENEDVIDQRPDRSEESSGSESAGSESAGSESSSASSGYGSSSGDSSGDGSSSGGDWSSGYRSSSYESSPRGFESRASSGGTSSNASSGGGSWNAASIGAVAAVIVALAVLGILRFTGHLGGKKSKTTSATQTEPQRVDKDKDRFASKDKEQEKKDKEAKEKEKEKEKKEKEKEEKEKEEKAKAKEKEKELVAFVKFVLKDQQTTFEKVYAAQRKAEKYRHAKLVLFEDTVATGCGDETSRTGPFYCPKDERAYIDLRWFDRLEKRYGAPGNFAQAYVIAHEIGHHIQRVSGMKVKTAQLTNGKDWNNALSVRQELQADCYAGVWGHSANQRKLLEIGDVEKALTAASAVGDDKIRPDLKPESFTHGTAEQRMRWFKVGFDSGKLDACNTFDATNL